MAAEKGKATRFRWLDVARWTVASVVTVAAVVVIVRAVVVMLRPEKLQMKLSGGYVQVQKVMSTQPPFKLVKFYNPSRRASINFTNVAVRLIDGGASAAVITKFDLPDAVYVPRKMAHDAIVGAILTPGEDVPMPYLLALFDGGSIGDTKMQVDGLLTSRIAGSVVRRDIPTTYYCWPVAFAVGNNSLLAGVLR